MSSGLLDGGADRNRTCDLLIANETLCQLSYDPNQLNDVYYAIKRRQGKLKRTFRGDGLRSNPLA